MSFRLFIYYCAICGAWAALMAWGLVQFTAVSTLSSDLARAALTAGTLGLLVAGAVGFLDALLNEVGFQRFPRVGICMVIGLVGGILGGFVGQLLFSFFNIPLVVGWTLVGSIIGISIGVYDMVRAKGDAARTARRKTWNGLCGGLLGGAVGGVLYSGLTLFNESNFLSLPALPRTTLAYGLIIVGLRIGLFIGLAQVFLKEAWVKVEAGFRAGRELILSKTETLIGRSEACDIGLFGDNTIDKTHARILQKNNRYYIADNGTDSGTYLNDQRLTDMQPLRTGDAIRVGKSVLRFGERQKRT